MKKKLIMYDLAPQMKAYDKLGQVWKPFIMYISPPNFKSEVVNLDKFGRRFTDSNTTNNLENSKNNSIFDEKIFSHKKETAVLLGGSSAFGIGASSDASTISSLLSKQTDTHFFNLGCSAFCGFQEITLFQSVVNRLTKINKIVIFSGLNDLFLSNHISTYDPTLGPFYFNNEFVEGMMNATINWKRSLSKFFLNPFIKNNINWNLITKKELFNYFFKKNSYTSLKLIDKEKVLKNILKRNFICWSNIQKAMGVKLIYVLQPMPNWCNKDLSDEETQIFKELDASSYKNFKTLKSLDLEKFNSYRTYISEICDELKIDLIDSNDYISSKNCHKEWLFIDRAHLTDLGNKYISELILSKL